MAPTFRGAAFVEHIRGRLWSGGKSGRATVMIGAGFSRNALPNSPSAPPFPLLENYRTVLAEGLGLDTPSASRLPLERLAGEYEASFGREALNNVITTLIPWRQHTPGPLHQLLLELPWADIFTLNYDQLLEDARAFVSDRKYDLVLHPDDIPTATPPRIVKLHGSFPSMRPFIFTDEDFRSYPRRFAPFVNLVQQGMMENTLCLLGFSGDDPNFLRWAGWVRDELGPHRPQMYLVGVLDLQDGRRRYLEELGVTPVDLAELFPWTADQNGSVRHQLATEWFLRSLANGEPPNRQRWPSSAVLSQPHSLPQDPLPARSSYVMPEREEDGQQTLSSAYKQARALRLAYPGWEVCPSEKRKSLHYEFRSWFGRTLIEEALQESAPLDLLIAREGVWQLALAGEPLTPSGVEALDTLLARTDPGSPPDGDANVTLPKAFSLTGKPEVLPWMEAKTAWVEVAFAQLVEAREDVHAERFLKWEEALRGPVRGNPDWEVRWHWEGVRWAITTLDREDAILRLSRWPINHSDPFWEARRAAALAEIGEIKAAHDLNQHTLNRVRAAQVPGQADYRLLSQEAWLLVQSRLMGIERGEWGAEVAANQRRLGRLSILRQYDCDPWEDLSRLKTEAAQSFVEMRTQREGLFEEREFDAGWVRRGRAVLGNTTGGTAGPALQLLRLSEWAAHPLRVGGVTFGSGELTPVLVPLVQGAAPRLGVLTAVRAGAGDALKVSLSRDTVANMQSEDASILIELLMSALKQAGEEAKRAGERMRHGEHHFSYQVLQHGLEALSRLMMHADSTQHRAAIELAGLLAGVHAVQRDFNFYEPLSHLLRRSVSAMSNGEKLEVLPSLAAFPIPSGNIALGERWPDPFPEQGFSVQLPAEFTPLSVNTGRRLLAQAEAPASSFERRTALVRLAALFRFGLLDQEHQRTLAQTLWRDRDEQGLPQNTPFHSFAFLKLPHPSEVDPVALLKARYLDGGAFQPLSEDAQEVIVNEDGPQARMRSDLMSLRADPLPWAAEDISTLLERFQAWWPGMTRAWQIIPEDWVDREAATLLLDVLKEVLLPHAGPHSGAVETFIYEVEQYFQAHGFSMSLGSTILSKQEAAQALLDALIGSAPDSVREASRRAVRILLPPFQEDQALNEELHRLRSALLNRVIYRAPPTLDAPLRAVAHLIDKGMVLESEELRQILLSLQYLIQETASQPGMGPTNEQRSERADLRAAASVLAAALYRQAQDDPPQTLLAWAEIGRSDPLPEVREPWNSPETASSESV